MSRKYYLLFFALLPLIIGLFVYLLMRNNTCLHKIIGFNPENPVIAPVGFLRKLIAHQLPDFCWSLSFASCLFLFQRKLGISARTIAPLVFFFLIVAEVIQYFLPGSFTFDWLDVGAAIIAFILSYFLKPSAI